MKVMSVILLFCCVGFCSTRAMKMAPEEANTQLVRAVTDRNILALKNLLQGGVCPTVVLDKKQGTSLLHKAIEYSLYECAFALVTKGASQTTVTAQSAWNKERSYFAHPYTPLLLVLDKVHKRAIDGRGGRADICPDVPPLIRALIVQGAQVDARLVNGDTPLHLVAHLSDFDCKKIIIDQLINCKAKLEAKNTLGRTPLFNMVLSGCFNSVKCLLDRGASVKVRDIHGRNLLMVYVSEHKEPNIALAELLVSKGISPKECDLKERDALWYAKDSGRSQDYIDFLGRLCDMSSSGL